MSEVRVRFGTDGWRGLVAEDFTVEGVGRAAWAAAQFWAREGEKRVLIGYDTRFLSDRFARRAAEVIAGAGLEAVLSDRATPTPAVSLAAIMRKAAGAVVITASHNPWRFNGFKLKTRDGTSAPPSHTAQVERMVIEAPPDPPRADPVLTDWLGPYLKRLGGLVRLGRGPVGGWRVVTDPMYGAARGLLPKVLGVLGRIGRVTEIHGNADPLFGGIHPEPIGSHLGELGREVRARRAVAGLAFDGDADRLGVVDERGRPVSPQMVYALLLRHLAEHRGLRGRAVRTVSGSAMIDRVGASVGIEVQETPIGFKHIAALMTASRDVVMGGEESGGYGFSFHIPERDGPLSGLLLLELITVSRRPLIRLIEDLQKRFGPSFYDREDIQVSPGSDPAEFHRAVESGMRARWGGKALAEVRTTDGVKAVFRGGEWLLVRRSGTEPVVRVYAEAASRARVKALLAVGRRLTTVSSSCNPSTSILT